MRMEIIASVVILAAVLDALPSQPPAAEAAFRNVVVGEPLTPFTVKDLDGKPWESRGRLGTGISVVVFWATWSPRSREIIEDLERLRAELGPDRLRLVAINAEHLELSGADQAAIRALIAETRSTATVLLDEGLVVFNALGTMALPSSLVLDAGRVTFALAGYPTTMRSDLADAVRKALGQPVTEELRPVPEYVPKNHALMYYNFGRMLREKGQEEKSVVQFRLAAERDPGFKKPFVELGLHHLRHGEIEPARAAFLKVREIDPQDAEAAYQAAAANLRLDRLEEAETILSELALEYPDRGGYALALALTWQFLGREEQHRAGLARAAGLHPPAPRVLYDLGRIAEHRGIPALAADLYRRALEDALR